MQIKFNKKLLFVLIGVVSIVIIYSYIYPSKYSVFKKQFGFEISNDLKFLEYSYKNFPFQEDVFKAKLLVPYNELNYIESKLKVFFEKNPIIEDTNTANATLKYFFDLGENLEEVDIVAKYANVKEGKYAKTVFVYAYIVYNDNNYYLYVVHL